MKDRFLKNMYFSKSSKMLEKHHLGALDYRIRVQRVKLMVITGLEIEFGHFCKRIIRRATGPGRVRSSLSLGLWLLGLWACSLFCSFGLLALSYRL